MYDDFCSICFWFIWVEKLKAFLFTFFVLSMPSLHLTNLVISLSLFYTPPLNVYPYWLMENVIFHSKSSIVAEN